MDAAILWIEEEEMSPRLSLLAVLAASIAALRPAAASPVQLAGYRPSWAVPANDEGPAPIQPLAHLTVVLAPPAARQRAFAAWRAAQDTPGSADYHHWLTPTEIGQRFGATAPELLAVTAWLRGKGFRILRVSSSRLFVEIAGTTVAAETAFGVRFHRYRVAGRDRLAIDRAPAVPAAISPFVSGVTGLIETLAHPLHVAPTRPPRSGLAPAVVDGAGNHWVGVADFATIYDLGPLYASGINGAGRTIGIVGRSRVLAADIANFGARMNVTMPSITTIVPPTGIDPGPACSTSSCANGDNSEATLDVERAGSVAPGASLDLIVSAATSTEDGVLIALEYAIDHFGTDVHDGIVSVSYGACEDAAGQASTNFLDALFQQAAAQGQTVFVASGDSGAAGCDPDGQAPPAQQSLGINFICASPAVTCVGGTEFSDPAPSDFWDGSGAAKSYIPEGAWNAPLDGSGNPSVWGTGGGASEFIPRPPYQLGVGPASATGRLTPDVSFTAAAHDPYYFCMAAYGGDCTGTYSFLGEGGTSASTPSMAGIMALVDQHAGGDQGAANPALYELAQAPANGVFHDVSVASSGVSSCDPAIPSMCNNSDPSPTGLTGGLAGFTVATGYDEATGWGSVDVSKLVENWPGSAPSPALTLDPTSLTIAPGSSADVALMTSGFFAAVTFACSGLPADATCTFSTNAAGAHVMTIHVAPQMGPARPVTGAGGLALFVIVLGLVLTVARPRARGPRPRRFALVAAALAVTAAVSCGREAAAPDASTTAADATSMSSDGPADASTPDSPADASTPDASNLPTTNSVTVTASDAAQSASAVLTLTVPAM